MCDVRVFYYCAPLHHCTKATTLIYRLPSQLSFIRLRFRLLFDWRATATDTALAAELVGCRPAVAAADASQWWRLRRGYAHATRTGRRLDAPAGLCQPWPI